MLFHSVDAPESGAYVTQVTCKVANLQVDALQTAWEQTIQRHAILRTAFAWKKGPRPLQVVGRNVQLSMAITDASELSANDFEEQFRELLVADRRRGFDLSKAPLMRLLLLKSGRDQYRLVWSHHHILLDGWSVHLLIHEVFARYAHLQRGGSIELPTVRPYGDYIRWLAQQDYEEAATFWRNYLVDFEANQWPAHRSESDAPIESGEERLALTADETSGLVSFAQQQQVTLNTLVQAAWAVVQRNYGETDWVTFGSIASGRPAELTQYESMVGLFINTLPIRIHVDSNVRIADWLKGIQREQAEIRRFEFSPLVKIKEWASIPQTAGLFRTMYAFENYPVEELSDMDAVGVEVSDYHVEETVNYPLTLVASCRDKLFLKLLFDAEQFAVPQIRDMLEQLRTVLLTLVQRPDRCVGELSLLTEEEQKHLASAWNQTKTDYPRQPLHELFEQCARDRSEAVAVVVNDRYVTYSDVNRRANQVARWLRGHGLRPEQPVGLCVVNALDLVVGSLAIVKAGGAYLPLDPSYPAERVRYMLHDAGASLLLADSSAVSMFELPAESVLCLDQVETYAMQASADLGLPVLPEQRAYVMYTSGSTGQPKGTSITHQAIIRLVRDTHYVQIQPTDCVAQASCHSFDAATFEIWGSLLNGARLVAVPKETAISPKDFAAFLREQHIDKLFLTTALFNQLSREDPESFASLDQLMTGGQTMDPQWMRRVIDHGPPRRLLHVYGPTETTTFATSYEVRQVAQGATSIPIGKPISNTWLHVLDDRMHLLPLEVHGELCIGGDGLAVGYHGRPALTAEKFIPDPYAHEPGMRLYRTGDRVYRCRGGDIEFAGRFDNQIKLRGFRIELGEIESALVSHPDVAEAIVVCRSTASDRKLVAYVVPKQQVETVGSVQEHLRARLPSYMLPSTIVTVPAWPLTANGKIDRHALPDPECTSPLRSAEHIGPRNPMEEAIVGAFASVLEVSRVGIHDSFFELGGHSLLATRVTSRLRETLACDVPLRHIFNYPTAAELARVMSPSQTGQDGELVAEAIRPADRNGHLPLSFGQQRLWFLDQLAPGSSAYNFHFALQLVGKLDLPAAQRSIEQIVQRHEVLRTVFESTPAGPVQRPHAALENSVGHIDLSMIAEADRMEELQRRNNEHAQTTFDLALGPLHRITFVGLAEDRHAVLVTMHHIVCDGWSMGIFVREFAALYRSFCEVGAPERSDHDDVLPPLPIQYADFAVWQRSTSHGRTLDSHLSYWKRQLHDLTLLDLPTDYPRPAEQTFRGARTTRKLPTDLATKIQSVARAEGTTLFMMLLAAFKVLLSRYAGQEDIVVGADIANRNRHETEDLIGFFANQLVLRSDLSGDPAFCDLLRQIRDTSLDAYAHQDVSFDKLVEALQPERDTSRNPLFQVMFILQNNPMPAFELPDLELHPLEFQQETTAFDITMSISEQPDGAIHLGCRYYADIFAESTIIRLLRNFETLLTSIVGNPKGRLSSQNHLTESDIQAKTDQQQKRKAKAFGKLAALRK